MCGIAGFIDPKLKKEDAVSILGHMLESIAHRGPDARGTWYHNDVALGHNRLSIIDLSEQANQPMIKDNIVITFNGEIYNYREIRLELEKMGYIFQTQSDTEVIIYSYKEWGPNCVNQFTGMWSFVIFDKNEKQLLYPATDLA